MRLVCGLSTLQLFKADLKISGWCYYTSEEEETTLAWPSRGAIVWLLLGWPGALAGMASTHQSGWCACGSCETGGGQEGGSGNRVPAVMRCNLALGLGRPHVYAIAHQARKPVALDFAGKVWAFLQTHFPLL